MMFLKLERGDLGLVAGSAGAGQTLLPCRLDRKCVSSWENVCGDSKDETVRGVPESRTASPTKEGQDACPHTFFTLFKYVLKQSGQITCPYSRCGLTNALCNSQSRCLYDLLMSPTSHFALFTAASTWSDSFNLLSI